MKLSPLQTVIVATALIAGLFVVTQPAATQQPAAPAAKWEYQTESVLTGQLQNRLTALGAAGWDVFSITRSDSVLENADGAPPRLRATEFQVTSKRPIK